MQKSQEELDRIENLIRSAVVEYLKTGKKLLTGSFATYNTTTWMPELMCPLSCVAGDNICGAKYESIMKDLGIDESCLWSFIWGFDQNQQVLTRKITGFDPDFFAMGARIRQEFAEHLTDGLLEKPRVENP